MKTKSLFIATAIALMTCAASAEPDLNSVSERLVKSMPGLTVDSISESAIPGLYEVVSGGEVAYVTSDGVHMIQGTLFNVPERKNLSEKALSAQRAKALGTIFARHSTVQHCFRAKIQRYQFLEPHGPAI